MHLLTSKLITHITWPICRDLLHDRIPVAPIAHTHTRAHAHPFGLLLLLPLLWASFLLTDSVTLADSDIDRYRRLHNTPKNNAALSAQWSGEHSSRRPGILLGLTTPLPKKKVACNMQQAMGKSLAMLRVKTRIGIINNVQCYSS